jgi:hypothetical protein
MESMKMKKAYINLIMALVCFFSTGAQAENTKNVLLYIQPMEYNNEVRLQYFWQEYWFAQGPMVEPIALEKLSQLYNNVNMCEGNETGSMLIWIQPRIFYNGQVKLFYGKISANVYTGLGKLVNTYVAEAKQFGSLDITPEISIKKVYTSAMSNLIEKLRADNNLQMLSNNDAIGNTPCSMVTFLPSPKIRVLGF